MDEWQSVSQFVVEKLATSNIIYMQQEFYKKSLAVKTRR